MSDQESSEESNYANDSEVEVSEQGSDSENSKADASAKGGDSSNEEDNDAGEESKRSEGSDDDQKSNASDDVKRRQVSDEEGSDDEKKRVVSDDEQKSEVSESEEKHRVSDDEEDKHDSDDEPKIRRKSRGILTDSSGSDEESERKEQDSDDDQKPSTSANLGLDLEDSEEEVERDEEEEEEVPEPPVSKIHVEIPKAPSDISNNDIYFVKFPNFLSVDTHPYDPSWYEDEIDEDEILDDEGKARLKLKVESTIRWRMVTDENGITNRESNTRLVKWSDGSISLHLGCEIFDIHKQTLPASDHNHLFIRQGTGLQGQAIFDKKLTFRPHSTESLTHRKMTLSLAERSHKIQKIRVLPTVGKDPEAHRSEMIKKEEDKLKASIRRENKVKRIKERAPYRGPTASYLEDNEYEDEDEDDGTSIKKIKDDIKNKKFGRKYDEIYSSDDDSDDLGATNDKKKKTAKVIESDEDE